MVRREIHEKRGYMSKKVIVIDHVEYDEKVRRQKSSFWRTKQIRKKLKEQQGVFVFQTAKRKILPEMFEELYENDSNTTIPIKCQKTTKRGRPVSNFSREINYMTLTLLVDGHSERCVARVCNCSRSTIRKREKWALNDLKMKYPQAFKNGIPILKRLFNEDRTLKKASPEELRKLLSTLGISIPKS